MALLISNEIDLLRKLEMLKVELELIPNSSNLQIFKELDIDNDNQIGVMDLRMFLVEKGCQITEEGLIAITRRIETKDTFCTQFVSLEEFSSFITSFKSKS